MTDPLGSTDLPTILVIDDDPDWRVLVRESLEQAGFRVFEESRGDRALQAVERRRPDVVVLDHHMPGIDGLQVTAFLHERWPTLPVVLTSSFGDPRTVERALGLGARYLDKPLRLGALVREVAKLSAVKTRR
jgi:two-component system nitrogen regulation response regulator NtrX